MATIAFPGVVFFPSGFSVQTLSSTSFSPPSSHLRTTLPRLVRRFWLVHHRRKQFSRGLAAFVEFCEQG